MPVRQTTCPNQRELFENHDAQPRWENFPVESQQAANKLLTKLFADHLPHHAASRARSEEAADE